MPRNKHLARNVGIVGAVLVGIVAIMLFGNISNFTLIEDNVLGEVNVSIPTLNALVDQGFIPISLPIGEDVTEATGIICKIKQTTLVYGTDNRQLQSFDSSGIQGSPFIPLAFLQGGTGTIEVVAYNINPKIFCSESSGLALEVFVRDMQVTTRASYQFGDLVVNNVILDSQGVTGSRLLNFGQGQGEQTLESFPVSVASIESSLPEQNFAIDLTFAVTGTVNVNYKNFPQITYQIPIFRADMETFHTIDIQKSIFAIIPPLDSDGDGYPDSTDACPFEPENFNGFEDLDGCPDDKPTQPPITNPPTECTNISVDECATECKNEGGVFVTIRDNSNNITGTYCDFSGSGEDPEPEKCDAGFTFDSATQTCKAPTTVINIEEEVAKGTILTVVEVVFTDGSNSITLAKTGSAFASEGFPDLQAQIGGLTPAVLIPDTITPSGIGITNKPISLIKLELFYLVSSSTPANSFGLDKVALRMTPFIIESSVSQATGTFINFRSADIGSPELITIDKKPVGTGFSLGFAQVTSPMLLDLGEDANILEGQAKTANIILQIEGSVDFITTGQSTKFVLGETTITFKDFLINNSKSPVADIVCNKDQIAEKDSNGKTLSCKTATPTDPTCITPERPSGFRCTPEEVLENCPNGDTFRCIEPDGDGDGVPDFKDKCPTEAEDGISSGLAVADDGCPAPSTPPPDCQPKSICEPKPEPPVIPPVVFCSEQNPEACIFDPEELTTILIIGAIGLVIVLVIVIILRRRSSRILGT